MSINTSVPFNVVGHCHIVDDLGQVHLDKNNAIHPQNMARIIARALSNESNHHIYRIAFGNGGTTVDSAFNVTYKSANDGQSPDSATWDSRIYNEIYSEIVDDTSSLVGTDPGSADLNTGGRSGGGAVPGDDSATNSVKSDELGLTSQVVITAEINGSEPLGQTGSDSSSSGGGSEFIFDEIGLYTTGKSIVATSGYARIDVGTRNSLDDTGLLAGTTYTFNVGVDGNAPLPVTFTTPALGGSGSSGEILYGDLCEAINTSSSAWGMGGSGNSAISGGMVVITDNSASVFPSIVGRQTYGFLQIESVNPGATSNITVGSDTDTVNFLSALNPPTGATVVENSIPGEDGGVQNDSDDPSNEAERLLAHLVFSPILKSENRTLLITYTLTISVERTTI